MFTFVIDLETARQILEAETCCYSEGQAGIPEALLTSIKENFPELAEQYKFLWGTSTKYQKKPVPVDAVQWTGENIGEVSAFTYPKRVRMGKLVKGTAKYLLELPTLAEVRTASPGDWIIRDTQGELYPCKPDIFQETYEPA